MKGKWLLKGLGLLGFVVLSVKTGSSLEIHMVDEGETVSSRQYELRVSVADSLPVQRVTIEINGKEIPLAPLSPGTHVQIRTPVELAFGRNLVGIRAETNKTRTSQLATLTYDGGDDAVAPMLQIVEPAENTTTDSTVVVRGVAYDDVKVAEVKVEGISVLPWDGSRTQNGKRDLVVEEEEWPQGDSLMFASVELPLSVGWNTLRVEARDQRGRTGQESVQIFRQPPFQGDRWAVVVGVSDYRAGVQSLNYADDDARALHEFLLSPRGGRFDPEKVRLLVDEEATSQGVRDALLVFLREAKREDLVIIYFSGHGASEPGRPDLVYLLTHDADPERLASTAFPMYDISTALRMHIAAERMLILADACHSGAILSLPTQVAMKSAEEENELVYRYFQELSDTSPGRAVFTASEAREQSQEGPQWGGGHGVFTYHLLEGMRGKADRDDNGVVTLGEVIDYTQRQVQEDTKGRQHPDPGGDFDRSLPLAVIRAR